MNILKNFNAPESQARRSILVTTLAAALAMASVVGLLQPARADIVTPPPVPDNLKVDDGLKAFLVGHARGTQNYICLPTSTGVAYTLFTPEATLFDDQGEQIITHFFSPNPAPADNGAIRATWLDSRDSSRVWAKAKASSTDSTFVREGAIAWVLLDAVGGQDGPTGGDRLTGTKQVQRLNTRGGIAPATGCASSADIGHAEFSPYTADYFFYR